jgi:CRP-like cAMP-binding protein
MPCSAAEISSLFLFEKLSSEQLGRLCSEGRIELFDPGPVFAEGDPATCFYVMIEGKVVMSRRVGSDDIEVSRTSQPGVYAGAVMAYVGDGKPQRYMNSLRVSEPTRFFVLPAESFANFMHEWFPMAVHLLEGLFLGSQTFQRAVGQRERLLALGCPLGQGYLFGRPLEPEAMLALVAAVPAFDDSPAVGPRSRAVGERLGERTGAIA